uniref:Uncharacterized protein n=1 Tax=Acrobeloides nanus TaxID=290746 RepID=A0A914CF53_9BILA
MVLMELRYPIYQLFIIIDTSVTLFVLRSYRNALRKCGSFLFDFAKMVVTGKKPQSKSTITFVKSVNNLTTR